ncbi:MAG TPA: SxtJ family membrane protein [Opitutaceae bacterium]|nr:SxtJ family membrane protein [Opitutaceae bacterium]
MSLVRLNPNSTSRELRQFAGLWLVFLGSLGVASWHKGAVDRAAIEAGLALTVGLTGLIAPRCVRIVYLAASYATFPVGYVVSTVVLAAVYFLVVTPLGRIVRLCGRDPLNRRFERKRESYWEARHPERSPTSYFRQHS